MTSQELKAATSELKAAEGSLAQLHDASAEPLVDAEITSAKRILMGAFPQQASGLTGVGGLAVASWLHGLPSDEWHTIVSRIHAVP